MEFIKHRVNTIKELNNIPKEYGCEIDIRTQGSKLILNHDPFKKGNDFIDYFDEYNNGTLVLNVKESGIERLILEEVRKRNIKSYFLLDVEFPYLFRSSKNGERNIAVRFSEMEPLENILLFQNKVDRVWIDTITQFPLNKKNIGVFNNFKTCLACPSRWCRKFNVIKYKKELNYKVDAVMTEINFIELWK